MIDTRTLEEQKSIAYVARGNVASRLSAALSEAGYTPVELSVEDMVEKIYSKPGIIVVEAAVFPSLEEFTAFLCEASGRRGILGLTADARTEAAVLSAISKQDLACVFDLCRTDEIESVAIPRLAVLETRLAREEPHDQLTGLGTRSAMRDGLLNAIREPIPGIAAAWMLDVDSMKHVNDTYGHETGDEVLRAIGKAVLTFPELRDEAYRVGGDEFGGIARSRTREEAAETLERLRQSIESTPLMANGQPIKITASIGFTFLTAGMPTESAYVQSDQAMYAAKAAGRNKVQCFDLCWDAADEDPNKAALDHFENVTRVWTERMSELIRSVGRRAMEESRRSAEHDGLTGLFNRAYYDRRMVREIENARRSGNPLSIALLDVDDFHGVNVEYGYPAGDLALKTVADLARNHSRLTDWTARYGGEEFVVIMPGTGAGEAAVVAERVRAALEAADIGTRDGRRIRLTASFGVACLSELAASETGAEALLQIASDRVMGAKRGGKNRVSSPGGVTAGPAPARRQGRGAYRRPIEILVVDDQDHARKQVEQALRANGHPSCNITWVETIEALRSCAGKRFDIAFVDFFLSKDRSYGTDALPDISADTLVGFSSKSAASTVIENEARRLGFRAVRAIEKNKDSVDNPILAEFLGAYLADPSNPRA